MQRLCCPLDAVLVPPIHVDAPRFTASKNWLEDTCKTIMQSYHQNEDDMGGERISPMALVRCSRGGKTRALYEIANRLSSSNPRIPVIFVTLNDFSCVDIRDRADPVSAICKRIAFAALSGRIFAESSKQWKSLAGNFVSVEQINSWLGNQGCVLLVDELNNLQMGQDLSTFLKDFFLKPTNRFLVFSSHVLATSQQLSDFMESASSRQVVVQHLPLVPSLKIAIESFDWPELNARQVLFYGSVPALVYEARKNSEQEIGVHLPSAKRDAAINACKEGNLVTDATIRHVLGSFITGDYRDVLAPLSQLMDTGTIRDGDEVRRIIRWIPYHMIPVLREFAKATGWDILRTIPDLFDQFRNAKRKSGDGWEALFVCVLLIRCLSRTFEANVFPLRADLEYSVSFNWPFSLKVDFDTKNLDVFLEGIVPPATFPHIAVYHPTHNMFELYDLLVVVWFTGNAVERYGFQLKEGAALPTKDAGMWFKKSYVIRGQAAQQEKEGSGWVRPSQDSISAFFGQSGSLWKPSNWEMLRGK